MSDNIRIQDDLYHAVNGEWLEKAVIPADRPTAGGFSELDQGVEKLMMADFAAFAKGEKKPEGDAMDDAVAFYKKAIDVKRRNEDGIKPVLPLLEKIKAIKTPDDLNNAELDLLLQMELPINCGVTEDMADATKHCFIVLGPSIILPDTTYYDDANPAKAPLLQVYSAMVSQALAFAPLSPEEQQQYLQDTLAFDALVAKKVKSQVEWADYVKNHNPMPLDEVANYVKPLDLKGFLGRLYGENLPQTLIVYDPKAIKECNGYFNEETFPLYIHWAYVRALLSASRFLSQELSAIGNLYRRTLMGIAEDPSVEKFAYQMVGGFYAEPVGVYYGRKYFGEEAKKDIVSIVKKIIEMYKSRVRNNTFLAEATKEKAILKLSTIAIKMGYPDAVNPFFLTLKVEEGDSFYETRCKLLSKRSMRELNKLYKPVDRSEWAMPGHMVNACYNPSANDITFPAAILQKPFYSLGQSIEENLGGIGAVIGHEISHAFDNNGAHFDENGNLANWWSEEDFKAFEKLTKDMIEQWDGIPFRGGAVNGTLVVSENIADNGGMAVTLAIMDTIKDANYQAYFKNWARVWCQKAKDEYVKLLLASDVHSPAELRANIQPRNFPQWYQAFGVTKDDKMYIPEDKRIIIW